MSEREKYFKYGKNMADRWLQRHESTIKAQQWIEIQKRLTTRLQAK
ncbi:hypothetical protein [Enterococcus alishanensis]